jgi:hypothetical protein
MEVPDGPSWKQKEEAEALVMERTSGATTLF